ncbi:LysM peptidoglycan-binding domain-containing protein [Nostoc sp. UHCC 0251]|uniref:LysM peptidoglycan-binding domain-containing protein n=1 Tax=Nostoc sp. UHCC 0251 TaxID=3110240 RepID=UPI002B1FD278|nr:LysM peptidoglycan-binding domain-containing protein [Nostoc sp. UHCC 0251]MEA5625320.1 LysM peptidoglycan-binding domain-containing protein [Nostoc sp. UHCC 0251]
MSTQPIVFSSGDTLTSVAHKILGESSGWRELADINDLDIFSLIEVGQTLTVPTKDAAERRIKNIAVENINSVNSRVQSIVNSREVKTITKLLGVDNTQLLKDLDLSSLAEKLSAPTKAERLKKVLNFETDVPIYRLVSWVF